MAADMKHQLDYLPSMPLPAPRDNAVFVGSGDSYAAALAAHYLSSGNAACYHPLDIISDPSLAKGHHVYFVSMSGRTRANVHAAKVAKSAGAHTTAITANPASPLAKACDDIFELRFPSAGRAAGTISFAASVFACTHVATQGRIGCSADLATIYRRASRAASRLARRAKTDSVIILGDSHLFAAALYGALKFNEVLGSRAVAYPLEEFFHAPLFGLQRGDQVLSLGKGMGLNIDCKMPSRIGSFMYAVFVLQHLVLVAAEKKKLKECYFLANKKLLKASSDSIY